MGSIDTAVKRDNEDIFARYPFFGIGVAFNVLISPEFECIVVVKLLNRGRRGVVLILAWECYGSGGVGEVESGVLKRLIGVASSSIGHYWEGGDSCFRSSSLMSRGIVANSESSRRMKLSALL
jgi:hypothetical protein